MNAPSLLLLLSALLMAQLGRPPATPPAGRAQPSAVLVEKRMEWIVDGVTREALVYAPVAATRTETPVIFAFHGHGGSARSAAALFDFPQHWPEAICVYMQGRPAPGKTDPEGQKNGWQRNVGDLEDRDLKFFDVVLASLKQTYKVDERRIYATGFSNGGGFTYVLWAAREDVFAAVAPAAAGMAGVASLKPKPAMHIAGERDTLAAFDMQQRMMEGVRKINGCDATGKEWAKPASGTCTIYESRTGTPLVTYIHPGAHTFPDDAAGLIVKFFQVQTRDVKKQDGGPAGP